MLDAWLFDSVEISSLSMKIEQTKLLIFSVSKKFLAILDEFLDVE